MQRSVAERFLASRSYSIEDERSVILNRIATQGVKAAADGNNDFVKNEMRKAESVIDDSLFTIKRFLEATNEAGHNMLHAAIIHKRLKIIDILFDYGNYLSNSLTNDENGDTPLTLAIRTYKNISVAPVQEQDSRELTTSSQSLGLEIIRKLILFGSKVNAENSKGDTPLILATKVKNHDVVKELCTHECLRVNHKNIWGKTALHYAVAFNLIEIVDSLLKCGASVLEADNDGYTPVHIACKHGRENMIVEMFAEMIPENTDVESEITKAIVDSTTNDGKTPLLVARCAVNPSLVIVKMLIKKGSDLEMADHFGNTALHLFNSKDDVDSCTRIFNKARDLGIRLLMKKNISLEIPLHVAASLGHLKICSFFMESADAATLTYKDIHGYTPIMKAIANGHQAVVKEMLVFHCKVTEKVQPHKTLLEWAIENEYSVLIKAMHNMCVERQQKMEEVFENITVPYLAKLAAKFGKDKILQSCIHIMKHGFKIQEKPGRQLSIDPYYKILRKSVKYGNLNCVKVVFKHTEQLSGLRVVNEDTLLHIACRKGYIEIVKYLLGQSPADPNVCNCIEGLPLACAASNGHEQLVEYLLDNGALLTKQCPNHRLDRSPLLLAAMNGHERVVEILLKQDNVDVNVKNTTTGYNCLCEAVMRGHRSTALAILKSKKWKQAMKFRGGSKNETPLRMMIQYMPDLAELALYQCITEEEHEHGHRLKKIVYSFELLEDCKTNDGDAITNYIGEKMKMFSSRPANSDRESQEERTTVFINHSFDSASASNTYTLVPEGDGGENGHKNDDKWLQPGYDKDNDVLQLMVMHKRISLLKHPLVSELLNYKWRYFGLPAYIFHFTFYVMVVALLTSMILVTPLPHGPVCSVRGCWSDWGSWSACQNPSKCDNFNVTRTRNRTCNIPEPGLGFNKGCHGNDTETMVCSDIEFNSFSLEANSSGNSIDQDGSIIAICKDSCRYGYSNFKNMSCQQKGMSEVGIRFLEAGTTVLLVIVVALIVLNAHKCYRRKMIYFKDLTTYIEATLSLSAIIFISLYLESSKNCFCASIGTWEAAVVAVFFGWIGLIIHLTKFPLTGIIINMLLSIFYTFLKLVIIAVLLCFTFALPLYMLLTQPGRRTPFSDIGRSMLKTLVMTTGEFEFDTIFVNEQALVDADLDLLFPTLTTIIWVIFIVTMPILFNNLLVGLAVGDTKEQLDNAQLTKFQLQIRIITEIQKALPVIHLIKRKELVVSRDTCSWTDWLFHSTPKLERKQTELHEWKSRADIVQIFNEQKRDDPIEKLITMQNEKLNRLENLLTFIVKSMDDEKILENERSQELAIVMANELSYSKLL